MNLGGSLPEQSVGGCPTGRGGWAEPGGGGYHVACAATYDDGDGIDVTLCRSEPTRCIFMGKNVGGASSTFTCAEFCAARGERCFDQRNEAGPCRLDCFDPNENDAAPSCTEANHTQICVCSRGCKL